MTTIAQTRSSAFRFRGRSFLHFVLTPELPLREWLADADTWLSRSPGFFTGKPVVLDVSSLGLGRYELTVLIEDLAHRGIQVLGLEGADPQWNASAGGLPPLLKGGRPTELGIAPPAPAETVSAMSEAPAQPLPEPAPLRLAATLVIDQPVRSGQTIEHPDGDVTVIGSVGSGAEIIAGGSIHIYGSLRGRALAGTSGDAKARIFCRKLEAELVAIDGYYRISEELEPHLLKRPAHAWLEDTTLNIAALD